MEEQRASGKVVIVTGGSSGIGRGISARLGADGNKMIVNFAGNEEEATETVGEITRAGGDARAVRANVASSADVQRLFDTAESAFGKVDILINNAGRAIRKPVVEMTDEDFHAVFDTNVAGAFYCMREAARRLRDDGRIINISASFQGAPIPGYAVYAASKLAIEQMTAVLAKELGSRRITVNAVRPGPTRTKLFMQGKNDEVVNHFASQVALGRIGEPDDVASVVSFLASPAAGWINGQAFGVNGGYW